MQELVRRLHALCDEQPFQTCWSLKNPRTGEAAHRDGDVIVPSGSVRKIAIMMTVLRAVHEGRLALDCPITIDSTYQRPENFSGCFQYFAPGFTVQLRDVVIMMIIVSDNTSTGILVEMVGLDSVNDLCRSIGMKGTTHRTYLPIPDLPRDHPVDATNATTAADVGLLLDLILQGTDDPSAAARLGCSPELCQVAIDILSWQKLRSKLPALLPARTKVAHKSGLGARNHNDAGIIFQGDQPLFILSALTEHVPEELPDGTPGYAAASHLLARMSRTCWDVLNA